MLENETFKPILKVGGGSIPAELSLAELDQDPHAGLARLRAQAPVAWVPGLDGWLVTGYAEAVAVMRDSRTFTVDDPRFSTARVVGPSMLSLDGKAHTRHRSPFFAAFHRGGAADRLPAFADAEAARLVDAIRPAGGGDLRRELSGPLAVAVVAEALGLGDVAPAEILALYTRIVGGVTGLSGDQGQEPQDTTGISEPDPDSVAAFGALADLLRAVIEGGSGAGDSSVLATAAAGGELSTDEVISDAAVVMFGGIDTTDGMIANAVLHLLGQPDQLDLVRADPGLLPAAVEESLRLEPAAAIVDRYATADAEVAGATIRAGDRVTVSITGANRDPAVFGDPDRFDLARPESGRHLAFAHGPHFCIGAPPARAETLAALRALLPLPGLRLDPAQPATPRGLVFRKPPTLHVLWD
ncbi:MAG TPA: cytochrome P450 [Streptosporangiaceae bacterium]|nr:cytochrome P450 [Streptosporangiaceae bacterium]